jgi:hypothetical protein
MHAFLQGSDIQVAMSSVHGSSRQPRVEAVIDLTRDWDPESVKGVQGHMDIATRNLQHAVIDLTRDSDSDSVKALQEDLDDEVEIIN